MNKNAPVVAALSLLMILCAGASNAVMDALATRHDQSLFSSLSPQAQQWWNPKLSHKNKWKDGEKSRGEAFPLSSTALSPLTDAWHFFKWSTITCLYAAILAPFTQIFRLRWYAWFGICLGCEILRGAVFELFYAQLLLR